MSNLSLSEIQKRPGRIEILLSKLAKNDVFETINGKIKASLLYWYPKNKSVVVFDPSDKKLFKLAQHALQKATSVSDKFTIVSKTQLSKYASLSELIKTAEFGGKGVGGGLVAESKAIKLLTESLEDSIKKNQGPISVSMRGYTVTDIVGIEKTAGTPKSDFHLFNSDKTPVIWISHKDGRGAKDFQQWGGISARIEPSIYNHPETQKFLEDLKKVYPNGVGAEPGQPPTVYRSIIDARLKFMSIYGNKYYTASLGPQNVSILLQGPPSFVSKGGNVFAFAANNIHYNGDSMDTTPFEPVFMAIRKGDRNDAGIKATRIVISPIAGRKAVEFLPLL